MSTARRHIGGKKNYGKLFLKTDSTSNNWRVQNLLGISATEYTIYDNVAISPIDGGSS